MPKLIPSELKKNAKGNILHILEDITGEYFISQGNKCFLKCDTNGWPLEELNLTTGGKTTKKLFPT